MSLDKTLQYFLQGLALGFPAASTPGPFQTFLIHRTLTAGWRRSALIAFAPLFSDGPAVLIILLLLNQFSANLLRWISFFGGFFVLYMAWGLWRGQQKLPKENEYNENPSNPDPGLRKGVLINILSPGMYAFWMIVSGPILLSAFRQSWFYGLAFLLGFYGALVGGFLVIIFLFHQTRRLGPKVVNFLILSSILVLVVFGVMLIIRSVNSI